MKRIAIVGLVLVFVLGLIIGAGGNPFDVFAEPDAPNPGHSWSEIGDLPGTMWHSNNDGAGSGLDADLLDGLDSAELQTTSLPWSSITSKPVGFADDIDNDILGGLSCANGDIAKWDGVAWHCASDDTGAGSFWALTGDSGTTPGTNFLGTTDNQALEFRVDNARALRLEPGTSPSVIGGYSGNSATAGAVGTTIGGGGGASALNRVTDDYGTVGGGRNNQAGDNAGTPSDRAYATIGGGASNTASHLYATVGGGYMNTAGGPDATVAGGYHNSASGDRATVGGGDNNNASGPYVTVGGGTHNTANSQFATVGGGTSNTANNQYATIGGGAGNTASAPFAMVGGGTNNNASNLYTTVGGGQNNVASGQNATVPGGQQNTAGGALSFAAGYYAQANHQGTFVWADTSGGPFASFANNQFSVRASGGVLLFTKSDLSTGCTLPAGSGTWSCSSDRSVKENFASVDGGEVLSRLAEVPIESWNYEGQDASIRHMGPMAQDFYAAFGLGEDKLHISTVDADGVALAAIQGLYEIVQELQDENAALEADNADLHQRFDDLEARVSALGDGVGANAPISRASTSGVPVTWVVLGSGLALALVGLALVRRRLARR
jgi:hypothetical protein